MQYLLTVMMCVLLAGCGSFNAIRSFFSGDSDWQSDERPLATTLVYDCNGYEFTARLGPGEMALWLPDGYVVLSQVRSASGTLYEEGDISFWSKGADAMLTLADQSFQNCQLVPERVPWEDARRRGVDFRAVGNAPGWQLEIQKGLQLLFVLDDSVQRVLAVNPAERVTATEQVYTGSSAGRDIEVDISEQPCTDSMHGIEYPYSVVVTLDNNRYQGCGQQLEYPWQDLE